MSLGLPTLRRCLVWFSLAVGALVLTGCSTEQTDQLKRLAQPAPASAQAPQIAEMWIWTWVAAMVIGVLVWGLILYASIHYRRRSDDDTPVQTRYNLPIEIFYTIAPIIVVIVFFFFTVRVQDRLANVAEDHTPDQYVTVVGQQWSWTFNYNTRWVGDNEKGKFEAQSAGPQVYEGGTTADRPTLWLVKDKTVEFDLYSPDVIHSFWVPAFLYKMDVIPGRHNHFALTPDRYGTFEGRCAELCGVYHSRMLFNVKVVNQQQYDDHLKSLGDQKNTGTALGASYDTKTPGLETEGATK